MHVQGVSFADFHSGIFLSGIIVQTHLCQTREVGDVDQEEYGNIKIRA